MQLMALTYVRPTAAMMQKRPTRVSQPSKKAEEAAAQAPAKRVHFSGDELAERTAAAAPATPDPLCVPLADTSYPDVPGVPEEYDYPDRVPQSFPHGLPPSTLEPGATD